MKVKSENEVAQSCPTLSDPMDCSLPDSSVHGIFQARALEWDAIAVSSHSYMKKQKKKKKSYSNMQIFKIIVSIYPSWIKKGLSKTFTKTER